MYTPEALLDAVLRQLRAEMGEVLVDPWFTNAEAITIQDDVFVVEAASELFRDTLTNRFTANVSDIITGLLGRTATPLYVFGPEADSWRLQSDSSVYAGPLKNSSWAIPINLPMQLRWRYPTIPPGCTTRCLFTAAPVWEKRTCCLPLQILCGKSTPATGSCTSKAKTL